MVTLPLLDWVSGNSASMIMSLHWMAQSVTVTMLLYYSKINVQAFLYLWVWPKCVTYQYIISEFQCMQCHNIIIYSEIVIKLQLQVTGTMLWLLQVVHVLLLVTLVAAVSAVLSCRMAAMSQEASATVMSAAISLETAVVISLIFNA